MWSCAQISRAVHNVNNAMELEKAHMPEATRCKVVNFLFWKSRATDVFNLSTLIMRK